jgi:sirohydrochlorin cobaltochelatase
LFPTFGHAARTVRSAQDCPSPPGRPTVLLTAHGTRHPDGSSEARAFAERLAERLGPDLPLVPCFLELTDPPILDTIAGLAQAGVAELVVIPLMLFGAGHVMNDVPAAIAVARERFPDLSIKYGAPLGVQPEMLAVVDERLREVEHQAPPSPRERTAVLVVERGSNDPDANAEVFQLARLVWERRGCGWVEPCFIGITRPSLDEGLARCVALGAERVVVLPYFLFTGVLVRRIARVIAERSFTLSGVDLRLAEHLGAHPCLLDLVARRIAEAIHGDVRMSCDRCVYRMPLAGFAHRVGRPHTSDAGHGLREGAGSNGHHDHALRRHQPDRPSAPST